MQIIHYFCCLFVSIAEMKIQRRKKSPCLDTIGCRSFSFPENEHNSLLCQSGFSFSWNVNTCSTCEKSPSWYDTTVEDKSVVLLCRRSLTLGVSLGEHLGVQPPAVPTFGLRKFKPISPSSRRSALESTCSFGWLVRGCMQSPGGVPTSIQGGGGVTIPGGFWEKGRCGIKGYVLVWS